MKKKIIRVESYSTYLDRLNAPVSVATRHGDTAYVTGLPPFDPEAGNAIQGPVERQTELVLEQLRHCLETAGSSLENGLKCNIYCTSVEKFAAVNAVCAQYFPKDPPARIFICIPPGGGSFDIEIDYFVARQSLTHKVMRSGRRADTDEMRHQPAAVPVMERDGRRARVKTRASGPVAEFLFSSRPCRVHVATQRERLRRARLYFHSSGTLHAAINCIATCCGNSVARFTNQFFSRPILVRQQDYRTNRIGFF